MKFTMQAAGVPKEVTTSPAAGRRLAPPARGALAALSLATLLAALGTSIANVALPTLALAFDAPFQDVQWVVLAYLLALTALVVSAGRLGDVTGRRRLMLAGLSLFTGASLAAALAPSLAMLVAARVAQGAGAAAMMSLTLAFVGETVPKERIGSAMGLLGTMSAVGTALGPSLGGLLIASFGWPSIFLVNLPLGLLAIALAARCLPPDRPAARPDGARFDLPGTAILAATLVAYALAMTMGRGRFGVLNASLLLAAVVGIALFALVESKAASPLVRLGMLRDPVRGAGFAMSALVTTVVMATLVVGPFHLAGALALDAARVGLVMSAGPAVAALMGVPAGRLVDRFGAHRMTLAGLVGMGIGTALLAMMPTGPGVPGYVAPLVVVTAGYALFQAANNTAVMAGGPAEQRGVLSGLLNLSRNLGLVTGASAMGAVFAFGAGTAAIATAAPQAIAAGTRITFAVAAALVLVAIAIAVAGHAGVRRATPVR
jgi:MFS family permease